MFNKREQPKGCSLVLVGDKLGFIGALPKPSPVGEGGPFMVEGVLAAGGPPMAVDEEFLTFVTTHPSARQYLILTIL